MTFNLALEEIAQNAYTSAHFGGNILATGDRLGADGTFDETAEALNIEFLRYPGGALTESCGCVYEAARATGDETGWDIDTRSAPDTLLPMTEMFGYAEEAGIAVTVVLPTRDFLSSETDANGDRYADVDEDAVRLLVSDVMSGNFGGMPEIQSFEIGNEYWGSGEMNAMEYGRVASEMATIINDEMAKHPNAAQFETTDILVQMGMNYGHSNLSNSFEGTAEEQLAAVNETYGLNLSPDDYIYSSGNVAWPKVNNAIIVNEFDTEAERESIDAVVAHIYSRGDETPNSRYFELSQIDDTWREAMPDLEVYATEWNLKRSVSDDRQDEFGLKQAHEMLNIVEAFEWGGVTAAHVWPVQMNSRTGLAKGEGDGDLRVAGEMFRIMSETLPGTRPLSLVGSERRETEIEGDTADVHSFFADDRLVTYLASTSDETQEQVVDFSNLVSSAEGVSITRLGVAEGENPTSTNAEPRVTQEDPEALIEDGVLMTDLAPHEILVIEMTNPVYTQELYSVAGASEELDPVIGALMIEGTPQAEAAEPNLLSFLMSGEETGPDESEDQGEAILPGLPVLPPQELPSEDESTAAAAADDDADDGGGGGLGFLGLALLPLLLLAGAG